MRFTCDSCNAQYTIRDEKVGPRGVKVRCKKCGHAIIVKAEGAQAGADKTVVAASQEPAAGQKTQIWKNPLNQEPADSEKTRVMMVTPEAPSVLKSLEEEEVSAALDQALTSSPSGKAAPDDTLEPLSEDGGDHVNTRIVQVDPHSRSDERSPGAGGSSGGSAEAYSHEWYVAIEDKQVGPMGLDKLRGHWQRGEVGPDSLCWRAGLADWVPLSDIPELAAELSPRPTRPVIVATPSGVRTSPAARMESPTGTRPNAKTGGNGPGETAGSERTVAEWRPSAASALASLVKEEVNGLARKPAPSAQSNAAPRELEPAAVPASVAVPAPLVPSPLMDRSPLSVAPAYGGPMAYPYGVPAPRQRGLWIGLSIGGAVLLALLVSVVFLALRQPVIVQQAPPVEDKRATAENKKVAAPEAPRAKVEPEKAPEKPVEEKSPAPSVAQAPSETRPSSAPRPKRRLQEDRSEAEPTEVEKPSRRVPEPGGDEFDSLFGGGSRSVPKPTAPSSAPRQASVYVPPAPGSGGDVQDKLGQSDIMQVVLSQKASLKKCVDEQRRRSPGVEGTLVMRWTVSPSGRTSNVTVVSDEFRSTYIASCMGTLIKGWTFPRHRVQGEPVTFPFKI